jgi:hypothetical protein
MTKTSLATRVAAAMAALVVSATASAEGVVQPEIGWGQIAGGRVSRDDLRRQAPALDAALGYRWDNGVGVRTMWIGALDVAKDFFVQDSPPTFREFWAVQATDNVAIASKLDFTAGLGVGRASFDRGQPGSHVESTEGVVSAGLRYQPFTHFALELHADFLTHSHERNVVLMAQVPF